MVVFDSLDNHPLHAIFEQLQVEKGAQEEMLIFYQQLSSLKQERVIHILKKEDPDIARLIIATVPKMRAVLDGKTKETPKNFIQSVLVSLKKLKPQSDS